MGPTLTLTARARVTTRRVLFDALRVVPPSVVERVHTRWTAASGGGRLALSPLARVLFYRSLGVREFTVPDGQGERLHAVGCRLERTLYWFGEGGYEPSEARWWRTLCRRSSDVLEIGANIGYYTVVGAAAAPGTRYTAVEANPEAAEIVRRNLALNGLDRVDVRQCAVVGDATADEVELAFPDQEEHSTAPTGSWVPTAAEGRDWVATKHRIRVPAACARALFTGRDLVKLDIEGAEADVLSAALPEIRAHRPIILVEVLPASAELRRLLGALLDDDRFVAFEMAERPRLLGRDDLDAGNRASRDVLVVPTERIADLA